MASDTSFGRRLLGGWAVLAVVADAQDVDLVVPAVGLLASRHLLRGLVGRDGPGRAEVAVALGLALVDAARRCRAIGQVLLSAARARARVEAERTTLNPPKRVQPEL
jgi:GNAT superfamily N-acetyltransferase